MSAPVTSNEIQHIVEQAIKEKIETAVYDWQLPVYVSDENEIKRDMPYIMVLSDGYEEVVTPGCGIFKINVNIHFRSHVKPTDEALRVSVIQSINNFAYSNAAIALSSGPNLHVYGFIPGASGRASANPDLKCFEYVTTWTLFCMPRANT